MQRQLSELSRTITSLPVESRLVMGSPGPAIVAAAEEFSSRFGCDGDAWSQRIGTAVDGQHRGIRLAACPVPGVDHQARRNRIGTRRSDVFGRPGTSGLQVVENAACFDTQPARDLKQAYSFWLNCNSCRQRFTGVLSAVGSFRYNLQTQTLGFSKLVIGGNKTPGIAFTFTGFFA